MARWFKIFLQVETLGDAVYMVAGGVPDVREDHAQRVAGLALDFVSEAHKVKCPIESKSLSVRIGQYCNYLDDLFQGHDLHSTFYPKRKSEQDGKFIARYWLSLPNPCKNPNLNPNPHLSQLPFQS